MGEGIDAIHLVLSLTALVLLPLLLMITTCFLKIAVVLVIVRNAIGVQQAPPTMALYAIALSLSLLVMAPGFAQIGERMQELDLMEMHPETAVDTLRDTAEPLQHFMKAHTDPELQQMFKGAASQLWPEEMMVDVAKDDFLILIPAFVVSELQTAFELGFLLYVPFLVIDLIISSLLLSLGMMMVAPMMVSLPLKILLFVLVDGWGLLLQGLVLSYA